MKKLLLFVSLFLFSFAINLLEAQCTPKSSDECNDIEMLCSLSELNGYCCRLTPFDPQIGCHPLCNGGPPTNNLELWPFVTNGGQVTITLQTSNCDSIGKGMQIAIWRDCSCQEMIACQSACNGLNTISMTATLSPCVVYYFMVAGCNGDVCDFCLSITGGAGPVFSPIGPIIGPSEVCMGELKIHYSAQSQNPCERNHQWTLDGQPIRTDEAYVDLAFNEEGSFELCVSAKFGNSSLNIVCSEEGPVCKTIKVSKENDRIGAPISLCPEKIPYRWYNQIVLGPGLYSNSFADPTTKCIFDSVREFIVLDPPEYPTVYYLGCDEDDFYKDSLTGSKFDQCQYNRFVKLPKSTEQFACDSGYFLNALFLNYNLIFREYCDSGRIIIEPRIIDRTLTCGNTAEFKQNYAYRWYLKSDSTKTTLDTQSYLKVKQKADYCIEILIAAEFGDQIKKCSFTYCEGWDEDQFVAYEICPEGEFVPKTGDSVHYTIDTTLHPQTTAQQWTIEGGIILTPNGGKDTNEIVVIWDEAAPERYLCYQYISNCGESKKCCHEVKIISSNTEVKLNANEILIIPNPVHQKFSIFTLQELKIETVILYDPMGHIVQNWNQPLSSEFSINELRSGLYYLKLKTDRGTIIKKVMIIN